MLKTYIKRPKSNEYEGISKLYKVIESDELQSSLDDQILYDLEEAYNTIDSELVETEETICEYEENENASGELEELKDILAEYKHYSTVEELKELIQRALF